MKSVFARALIEDFSRAVSPMWLGEMVKLAFRFIKRRIFSFMTQKSRDLSLGRAELCRFSLLQFEPDFLAKKEKLKDSFQLVREE